jgi:hypothetical protein
MVAVDRRVGSSSCFELEPLVEKLRCLGQGGRAEAEGALDDAGLPQMSRVTLKADACPLRSARITSKPLIVA